MRELFKCRNLEMRLCNSSKRCFPSPRFAPHHALLGDPVYSGSCNSKEESYDLRDITCNSTQHRVSHMSDSRVYRRDWRQFSSVQVRVLSQGTHVSCNREFEADCNGEFATSSQQLSKWVLSQLSAGVVKRWLTCNIWSVRLLQFVCQDPLLGDD
jgi:hypothetical protein